MATKRKTPAPHRKLQRPSRQQKSSVQAWPVAVSDEQFIFTFDLNCTRRSHVCGSIDVLAQSLGAALSRAHAVLNSESMTLGVTIGNKAGWPGGRNESEYIRLRINEQCTLTLDNVIMICDMKGNSFMPARGSLTDNTDVGDLFY